VKCDRYCATSLLEPMLLRSWTTVDLVDSCGSEGAEYARCWTTWLEIGVACLLATVSAPRRAATLPALVAARTAFAATTDILCLYVMRLSVWSDSVVRLSSELPASFLSRSLG
jgi:hypothetical protein